MNILHHLELLLTAMLCCLLHPMTRSAASFPAKLAIAAVLFVLALSAGRPDAPAVAAQWEPLEPPPDAPPGQAPDCAARFCPEDPVSCAQAEATAAGVWPPPAIQWSG